jgi:hypothetical protein
VWCVASTRCRCCMFKEREHFVSLFLFSRFRLNNHDMWRCFTPTKIDRGLDDRVKVVERSHFFWQQRVFTRGWPNEIDPKAARSNIGVSLG